MHLFKWLGDRFSGRAKPALIAGRRNRVVELSFKTLEERRVLNADAAVADVLVIDAGVHASDGQTDVFHVEQDAEHVRVSVNGEEAGAIAANAGTEIRIVGSSDNDVLIADLLASASPVTFNGGGGHDTLHFTSGASHDDVQYTLGDREGDLTIEARSSDGSASFQLSGVEQIEDAVEAREREFEVFGGGKHVSLSSAGEGWSQLHVRETGDTTIRFQSPSDALKIDTRGGPADATDRIEVDSAGGAFDADLVVEGSYDDVLVHSGVTHLGSGGLSFRAGEVVLNGVIITEGGELSVQASESINLTANAMVRTLGGRVILNSGEDGFTKISGLIDVSHAQSGSVGGTVEVLGGTVSVASGARIDASGDAGGGAIYLGGGQQGALLTGFGAAVRNTERTTIEAGATLHANTYRSGSGGRIIVWAEDTTVFSGVASARGGVESGDGGFVETSGRLRLQLIGAADTSASDGQAGVWLLDPTDVSIVASVPSSPPAALVGVNSGGTTTFSDPTNQAASFVLASNLVAALEGGSNVVVTTSSAGSGTGDITVETDIAPDLSAASGAQVVTLTLNADGNIAVNSGVMIGPSGADNNDQFSVSLMAGGAVTISGVIDLTQGLDGALSIDAGGAITDGTTGGINVGAGSLTGDSVTLGESGEQINFSSLVAMARMGDINITETGGLAALSLNAGTGDVTLNTSGPIADPDLLVDVIGERVSLTATTGSIGSIPSPIGISAGTAFSANTAASNGSVFVSSTANLPLAEVNAGTGAVLLDVTGAILDTSSDLVDVTAGDATLIATTTIGTIVNFAVADVGVDSAGAGAALEIDLSGSLTAVAGTLHLIQQGNLTLAPGNVTINGEGQAILQATGNLHASAVSSATLLSAGDSLALLAGGVLTVPDAGYSTGADLRMVGDGGVATPSDGAQSFAANDLFYRSGTGETIDTTVATISAQVTAGDLVINENDSLSLNLVQASGVATINAGEQINSVSNDRVADVVAATINLNSTSGGVGAASPVDVTATAALNVNTSAANGAVRVDSIGDLPVGLVNAGTGAVTLDSTMSISSVTDDNVADINAGSVSLLAAIGGVGVGSALDITATIAVNADTAAGDGGDILIDGIGDLPIGLVNAGAGTVTLTADDNPLTLAIVEGAISDALGAEGAGGENVLAATAILTALNGIGSGTGDVGDSADLDFDVTTLSAVNTVTGTIQVADSNDLVLEAVDNGTRMVVVDAAGSITETATAGPSIVGGDALVRGGTGVGPLNTSVTRLEASGGIGGLAVSNDRSFGVADIGSLTGAEAAGGIAIATTVGDLTVNESIASTTGAVLLSTANGITINEGVSAASTLRIDVGANNLTALTVAPTATLTSSGGTIGSGLLAVDTSGASPRLSALDQSGLAAGTPLLVQGETVTFVVRVSETSTNANIVIQVDAREANTVVAPTELFPDTVTPQPAGELFGRITQQQATPDAVSGFQAGEFPHTFLASPDGAGTDMLFVATRVDQFAGGQTTVTIGGTNVLEFEQASGTLGANVSTPLDDFFATVGTDAQVGILSIIAVPVQPFTVFIPVQITEAEEETATPLPIFDLPSPSPTIVPQATDPEVISNTASSTSQGEERYYELRVVSSAPDGRLIETSEQRINLSDPTLKSIAPFNPSKLPELFKRLPSDRYRLYLVEDGDERFVLEFVIEQSGGEGRPAELPERIEAAPDGSTEETEPSAGNFVVPQFGADDAERRADDLAGRLARASFVSSGGAVFGAALLSSEARRRREEAADRRMSRFRHQRPCKTAGDDRAGAGISSRCRRRPSWRPL